MANISFKIIVEDLHRTNDSNSNSSANSELVAAIIILSFISVVISIIAAFLFIKNRQAFSKKENNGK